MEATIRQSEPKPSAIEQAEEAKLQQKYPNIGRKGIGSSLLQKRLNKGQKYFDSGDYNMAKARVLQQKKPLPPTSEKEILQESTGETIPTPDNVPAVRKKSMMVSGGSANPSAIPEAAAVAMVASTMAPPTLPPPPALHTDTLPHPEGK